MVLNPIDHPKNAKLLVRLINPQGTIHEVYVVQWSSDGKYVKLQFEDLQTFWQSIDDPYYEALYAIDKGGGINPPPDLE